MPSMGAIRRPELNIFYVLDTSGSMRGQPMAKLNRAMQNTVDTLREEALHNRDADLKIAVLKFNTSFSWISSKPERISDFYWEDLQASDFTMVGAALDELNSKLTDKPGGFINSSSGALMPVIIFMSDGWANDDYNQALERIRQNKWFSRATRVGFAIGKNADMEMLSRLAGDANAVLRTEELNKFASLLKWVSVTSSELSSQTSTSGYGNRGRDAVRAANMRAGYDADDVGHGYKYSEDPVQGGSWGPTADEVFSNTDEFYSTDSF